MVEMVEMADGWAGFGYQGQRYAAGLGYLQTATGGDRKIVNPLSGLASYSSGTQTEFLLGEISNRIQ